MDDLDAVISIDTQISGLGKPDYWREIITGYIQDKENRFFLVAVKDNQVAGFIIGEVRAWEFGSADCGWVFTIGIRPDTRLDGVGSRLLDSLCRAFRQAGVTKVRTMTARHEHELMSFFRSQGMMAGPYLQLEKEIE
jgi:N-acetylglutamate synthase-like GNAT family acetyltransferase